MSPPPDDFCVSIGVPEHLHQCDRSAHEGYFPGEVAYRRHPAQINEVKNVVSFRTKDSSVNRSGFCEVTDVLINDLDGSTRDLDVACFPMDFFVGKKWLKKQDGKDIEITVEICHAPLRCNYAHCNLVFREDGREVDELKSNAVKAEIREELAKVMWRVHPTKSAWLESKPE